MFTVIRRISTPYMAYVLLLMGFVSLGLFVAALATESMLAAALSAAVLVACITASVAGFRAAARTLEPGSATSIFSTPLRQDEIDRYLADHRGDSGKTRLTVLAGGQATDRDAGRRIPDRLSA